MSCSTARMKFDDFATLGVVGLGDAMVCKRDGRKLKSLLKESTSRKPEPLQWVHVVAFPKYQRIFESLQTLVLVVQGNLILGASWHGED